MRKFYTLLTSVALLICQQSFADVTKSTDPFETSSKECESIATTCLSAGFARDGAAGKEFWHDCFKPILLGSTTVPGVSVDSKIVRMCREFKISNLKNQIQELQKVGK